MQIQFLSILFLCVFFSIIQQGSSLWCYQCVSTQPGCGTPFNWLWYWTKICPEDDDVCVKIIEEKDGETVITRDCLSSMQAIRTDIPADHYEGCRAAAVDEKLGHYVNNSIKELDIHRTYYDKTTWCFCFLDHRCNDSTTQSPSFILTGIGLVLTIFTMAFY
ncbi:unnamed protein product [Brassicogethes aeneus]|uniref:Protein sleepless n=1 Tax=Brassicogethes aeneus TaxID=1431903 RepID=A0A9P0BAR6_BRAAE|nr:unnamed protein product [Brassicogethes aeneus]